jgi:hypothetical protein
MSRSEWTRSDWQRHLINMMEEAQGWQRVPGKWQGVVAPQWKDGGGVKTSSGEFGELGEEEIRIAKEDSTNDGIKI